MFKNFTFFSLLMFLVFQVTAQNNPNFYLAPNGVTCMCPDAAFGVSGTITINGVEKTFTKRTETDLRGLINADELDPQIALTCTSGITDMSRFFDRKTDFNQDISSWDVSSVTDMSSMFYVASSFNQTLDNWDVSNVSNMSRMFLYAISSNQPLDNWDVSNVTDMSGMFANAETFDHHLNSWDVSSVTDMSSMFSGANSFNQPLNNWDVSSVTDMSQMFNRADSFNQPLDNWDVSSVTDMSIMFLNAETFDQNLSNWTFHPDVDFVNFISYSGLSVNNYDLLLQAFSTQNLQNKNLGAELIGYCNESARDQLINDRAWNIEGDVNSKCNESLTPSTTPFVTTWTVTDVNPAITLNIPNFYNYNFDVNWGDGNIENSVTQTITHTYTSAGTYTVEIIGVFPYFSLCNNPNSNCNNTDKLTTVESWGDQEWLLMHSSFRLAFNFNMLALDTPNLAKVTDMSWMFSDAFSFNQTLNNWDVSSVTDMSQMFYSTRSFNQTLNNWDVSSVTDMSQMFFSADSFNQPLDSWDVSSVTDMSRMFFSADSFNQPLNNWDVSNVTDMSYIFFEAHSFNQTLSSWDVSSVKNMQYMFYDALSFNQDISGWCVEQIPTEPVGFSVNSSLQNSFKPNWGAACEILSVSQAKKIIMTMYPNPTKDIVYIDNQSDSDLKSIIIYDMIGREFINQTLSAENIYNIDISGLSSGNYIVQLFTSDNMKLTKRLTVK